MDRPRYAALTAALGALLLLAMAPSRPVAQEFAPDLGIGDVEPIFEDEGRVLVLRVRVENVGFEPSPETQVRAFAWEVFETGVPPLDNDADTSVDIPMPIPAELGGSVHEIEVVVDPDGEIPDLEPDNNRVRLRVELPPQPEEPQPPDEGEFFVEDIQPRTVRQDEEFTLEVFGGGFQPGVEVFFEEGEFGAAGHGLLRPAPEVNAQAIELGEVRFESESYLTVDGYVPPDAPIGPRVIVVANPDGAVLRVEGQFEVRQASTVQPTGGGGGVSPWPFVFGAGVVLLVGAGGLGLTLSLTARANRINRQKRARKQDPPDQCTPGSRWIKKDEIQVKPGRWHVAALTALLYDSRSGATGGQHEVGQPLVDEINEAIRTARRARDAEATLDRAFVANVEAFADYLISLQALEASTRDVSLDASLEGGEVEFQFTEYRCRGTPGNSRWVKVREWTASVKATDRQAGTVLGPQTTETHEVYVARTRLEVKQRLQALVETVARMGL